MSKALSNQFKALSSVAYLFDLDSTQKKIQLLSSKMDYSSADHKYIIPYHDLLLFLLAYPDNQKVHDLSTAALGAISKYFNKNYVANDPQFENSGLPNTHMYSRFTHNFTQWISEQKECDTRLYGFEEEQQSLNDILKQTLPLIEQEITSAAYPNDELFDALEIKKEHRLQFLLDEFSKLDHQPLLKDHCWEASKPLTDVHFKASNWSRTWNSISMHPLFFHSEIMKRFDYKELLNNKLPKPTKLTSIQISELNEVIKKNLVLTMRETDPVTYTDLSTLRYYQLERGVSVAIFGIIPERQYAICSYIGYTLFKNGYPLSYGGSWVSGSTANFGINIFEPYRGGESAYTLIQLLRVYRQAFGVNYFEIEPYQFGQDNPDGIKSGAFWFYYRFGFRPVDKALAKLAGSEFQKIQSTKGYRTSEQILIRFTECNLALKLADEVALAFINSREQISKMIAQRFDGNRQKAVHWSVLLLSQKCSITVPKNKDTLRTFETFALLVEALQCNNKDTLQWLPKIINTKHKNPFRYNLFLSKFIMALNSK